MAPSKHTILMIQPFMNATSRTYYDFPTVTEAVNEVVMLFERDLKRLNPTIPRIQYSIENVYQYIDSLREIALLINESHNSYTLIPREGIKKRIHELLLQQSSRN